MKKAFFLLSILLISSCKSDDDNPNNPNLTPVNVNFSINLNLPQYVNLRVPGGIFEDRTEGRGIKGVVIYNQNNDQFFAYELSDPNLSPSLPCSNLTVEGSRASSNCNGNENIYEITSLGQQIKGTGGRPLLPYKAIKEGNTIFVTN
ncbi:hypothetical protein [Aquimarina mytili]|uniref:Nitrite reductase/ring-hydroxylating ferredoxin subunit n=1 Tax=Aquimarina mytili TaxID=874423 RepID=A0A937D8Y5_9FLAO|nr:hypothetical protein [Aquimarina mytili]MBL0681958.1 hypothetical protein [Aquimarina mytili]